VPADGVPADDAVCPSGGVDPAANGIDPPLEARSAVDESRSDGAAASGGEAACAGELDSAGSVGDDDTCGAPATAPPPGVASTAVGRGSVGAARTVSGAASSSRGVAPGDVSSAAVGVGAVGVGVAGADVGFAVVGRGVVAASDVAASDVAASGVAPSGVASSGTADSGADCRGVSDGSSSTPSPAEGADPPRGSSCGESCPASRPVSWPVSRLVSSPDGDAGSAFDPVSTESGGADSALSDDDASCGGCDGVGSGVEDVGPSCPDSDGTDEEGPAWSGSPREACPSVPGTSSGAGVLTFSGAGSPGSSAWAAYDVTTPAARTAIDVPTARAARTPRRRPDGGERGRVTRLLRWPGRADVATVRRCSDDVGGHRSPEKEETDAKV